MLQFTRSFPYLLCFYETRQVGLDTITVQTSLQTANIKENNRTEKVGISDQNLLEIVPWWFKKQMPWLKSSFWTKFDSQPEWHVTSKVVKTQKPNHGALLS